MRLDWFQAPTEELEAITLLVNLHPLPIVLDLCIHSVGTLFDCLGNRAARLRLEVRYNVHVRTVSLACAQMIALHLKKSVVFNAHLMYAT